MLVMASLMMSAAMAFYHWSFPAGIAQSRAQTEHRFDFYVSNLKREIANMPRPSRLASTWRLHQSSGRSGKSFVALNCSGILKTLFESKIFGHETSAFTEAAKHCSQAPY